MYLWVFIDSICIYIISISLWFLFQSPWLLKPESRQEFGINVIVERFIQWRQVPETEAEDDDDDCGDFFAAICFHFEPAG